MSARTPKVDHWLSTDGLWRFALIAGNNEPMAASQGYKTRAGCLRGIAAARKAWARAAVRLVACAPSRR